MKFLYLCSDPGIPVLGVKGASVHVREFVSALMDQGHTVCLVCAKRGSGNEISDLSPIEIAPGDGHVTRDAELSLQRIGTRTMPASKTPDVERRLVDEFKKLAYNLQLEPALERIIAEARPDVLYERYALFSYAGANVARKYHLPHLLEVNAPLIQERQSTRGVIMVGAAQDIEDRVFSQADAVLPVSSMLREYAIERGVQPGRITIMPNGVDPDKFKPAIWNENSRSSQRQVSGLPGDIGSSTVIGFVGSLKPWHGVDALIQAFARARRFSPRLYLLIVGEGPQLDKLKAAARALGLSDQILFTGAVPHHLIPQYLALMDIAVAPYRRQAHFYFSPLKILEYMAMGKAVIATPQGQISELIEQEHNGLLVEAENVEALAEALIRLSGDRDLRRRLGENAAAGIAQEHTWSRVATQVVTLAASLSPLQAQNTGPGSRSEM